MSFDASVEQIQAPTPAAAHFPTRVLVLEDKAGDAEALRQRLWKDGTAFVSLWHETRQAFVRTIADFRPDLILSDRVLSASGVLTALKQQPRARAVIAAGVSLDDLISRLKTLATYDYLAKDDQPRLGPAVQRALSELEAARPRQASAGRAGYGARPFATLRAG